MNNDKNYGSRIVKKQHNKFINSASDSDSENEMFYDTSSKTNSRNQVNLDFLNSS